MFARDDRHDGLLILVTILVRGCPEKGEEASREARAERRKMSNKQGSSTHPECSMSSLLLLHSNYCSDSLPPYLPCFSFCFFFFTSFCFCSNSSGFCASSPNS